MSDDLTRATATADALSGLHALRPAPLLPPLGSGLSWEVHTHQQGTGRAWTPAPAPGCQAFFSSSSSTTSASTMSSSSPCGAADSAPASADSAPCWA